MGQSQDKFQIKDKNKSYQQQDDITVIKRLQCYEKLIAMGFDDTKSFEASQIHHNVEEAIQYLVSMKADNDKASTLKMINENKNDTKHEEHQDKKDLRDINETQDNDNQRKLEEEQQQEKQQQKNITNKVSNINNLETENTSKKIINNNDGMKDKTENNNNDNIEQEDKKEEAEQINKQEIEQKQPPSQPEAKASESGQPSQPSQVLQVETTTEREQASGASEEEQTEDKNKVWNICGGISECKALDRIIRSLQFHEMYRNIDKNNIDKISEYFSINKHDIINDYHHILKCHLNEDNIAKSEVDKQFEVIHGKMMKENNHLCCDIQTCQIYRRSNRERENDKNVNNTINDHNVLKYMELLDCVHCYFLHSVDTGYRIINGLNETDTNHTNNDKDNDESICYDKHLFALKSYLKTKRKHLEEIRGSDRIQHNKFSTQLASGYTQLNVVIPTETLNSATEIETETETKSDVNDVDDEQEDSAEQYDYSFGLRYRYWNNGGFGDYDFNFAKAKYSTLKEELVMNNIHCLQIHVFQSVLEKAKDLMNTSDIIKSIRCNDEYSYSYYELKTGEPLHINHVLAVILYTDYDTLSYKFSSTFRKTEIDKTNDDVLVRNQEYGNWCKYLVEIVNCYGTRVDISSINVFYHGTSLMYFDKFIATFNSPTSTTPNLQIAIIFAKNDGIILELKENKDEYSHHCKLRYFNCSFISYFGNENEKLFIQPPVPIHYYLKFNKIRNMKTDEDYGHFINVFAQFEKLLNWGDDKTKSKILQLGGSYKRVLSKVSAEHVQTINELMELSLGIYNNKKFPLYILNCFKKWTHNIVKIKMDRKILKQYAHGFKIWTETTDNFLKLDKLNKVFENVEKIDCRNIGKINGSYVQSLLLMIKSINELTYSRLNSISLGPGEIMLSSVEFAQYQSLFTKNGWNMKRFTHPFKSTLWFTTLDGNWFKN